MYNNKLMHLERKCVVIRMCALNIYTFHYLETNGHSPPMTYRECQQ